MEIIRFNESFFYKQLKKIVTNNLLNPLDFRSIHNNQTIKKNRMKPNINNNNYNKIYFMHQ